MSLPFVSLYLLYSQFCVWATFLTLRFVDLTAGAICGKRQFLLISAKKPYQSILNTYLSPEYPKAWPNVSTRWVNSFLPRNQKKTTYPNPKTLPSWITKSRKKKTPTPDLTTKPPQKAEKIGHLDEEHQPGLCTLVEPHRLVTSQPTLNENSITNQTKILGSLYWMLSKTMEQRKSLPPET